MSDAQERKPRFETMAGLPVERCYTPADLPAGWTEREKLGLPGEYPFTRGVQPTMYRGRLWTMRMFAGFGTPRGHQPALQVPPGPRDRPGCPPPSTCRA